MHTPLVRANRWSWLVATLVLVGWCAGVQAGGRFSFGDVEKPNPAFTRSGDRITAKFIPRAKSTSVSVEFQVAAGGTLEQVKGVDFFTIDRPEVDIKNFKSAAFEIDIRDVTPGGTATVAVRSDFFSLSTAYFVFNPHLAAPWIRDAQTENRLLEQRVREIIVQVQDGGDRDADGAANGRIVLIGGPRDSFWGYALGTLFIRFFGIFFVLSLLMLGMLASGRVFTLLDRLRQGKPAAGTAGSAAASETEPSPGPGENGGYPQSVPETVVAAIGAVLYLRNRRDRAAAGPPSAAAPGSAWATAGRQRIMQDRLAVFRSAGNRSGR